MKTAENLLRLLGVEYYTERLIKIINDFIKSEDKDVKKLLDQIGKWDSNDLKQAELWMRSHQPTLPSDAVRTLANLSGYTVDEIEDSEPVYINQGIAIQAMEEYASARIAEMEREIEELKADIDVLEARLLLKD